MKHIGITKVLPSNDYKKLNVVDNYGEMYMLSLKEIISFCETHFPYNLQRSLKLNEGECISAISRFGVVDLKFFVDEELEHSILAKFILWKQ